MKAVVHLERVWKSYPRWAAGTRTLSTVIRERIPALTRDFDRRWALKDVSLEVGPGESVGLIGANGAGKSTLLRLASQLGRPTRGRVVVLGDVASVLSLGESFELTLTGRENAMTAAIVAGMRRPQARRSVALALEFAELEAFAEAPMRTYSEGMKLRLAFGVVAQLRPTALMLDEVLAVGDLRFQARCLERIRDMREAGTALLFASHSLDQVVEECDRVVWLQAGGVRSSGDAAAVVAEYRTAMHSETMDRTPAQDGDGESDLELRRNRFGTQQVTIDRVVLTGPSGRPTAEITSGSGVTVSLVLRNHGDPVLDPIVSLAIHRVSDGIICYDSSTMADGVGLGRLEDELSLKLVFEQLALLPGEYVLDVGVYEPGWAVAYDFHWQAYPLRVGGHAVDRGVFRPPHRWQVTAKVDAGRLV